MELSRIDPTFEKRILRDIISLEFEINTSGTTQLKDHANRILEDIRRNVASLAATYSSSMAFSKSPKFDSDDSSSATLVEDEEYYYIPSKLASEELQRNLGLGPERWKEAKVSTRPPLPNVLI